MARNKEYDRDTVLDAATRIFWAKGFKGTSMNDLVSGTGLNKHSMYKEFGSKEGLFRECIDNFALKTTKEVNIILTREPLGLGNIEAFFRNRIDYASSWECSGCMMVNTAIEKELIDEKAFAQVQKYFPATKKPSTNAWRPPRQMGNSPGKKTAVFWQATCSPLQPGPW